MELKLALNVASLSKILSLKMKDGQYKWYYPCIFAIDFSQVTKEMIWI